MYKGVILDFNGTLFEDFDLQADAWAVIIRRYFHREMGPTEFRDCFHGLGNLDILAYINSLDPEKQFDVSVTDEKEIAYRQLCREQPGRAVFVPGVEETLDALKADGIPMAIATACEISNVNFIIETFHLERWFSRDRIVYDDRTFPLKPAPDVYLHAAARLGLDPADCVVCEDSPNGIKAAEDAGIGRIIVRRSGQRVESIYHDPKIYAYIDDFTGFYPKFLSRS